MSEPKLSSSHHYLDSTSGAIFTGGKEWNYHYRYLLWRNWDVTKPKILFIGLNPSTAGADEDDPTIRRVRGFAKDLGFGGVYMANLFAHVSTDPSILTKVQFPIGPQNDQYLDIAQRQCSHTMFAWGSNKATGLGGRDKYVVGMFPNALTLKKTKDGYPNHPLYLPKDIRPVYFNDGKPWEDIK